MFNYPSSDPHLYEVAQHEYNLSDILFYFDNNTTNNSKYLSVKTCGVSDILHEN